MINALLLASRRARERGGALELVVPAEATAVRRTLEIANVQMILPFHATRAEGIARLTSARRPRVLRSAPVADDAALPTRRWSRAHGDVTVLRARIAGDPPVRGLTARPDPRRSHRDDDQERRAA